MRKIRTIPKSWSRLRVEQLIELREGIDALIFSKHLKEKIDESREREDVYQVQSEEELDRLLASLGEDA